MSMGKPCLPDVMQTNQDNTYRIGREPISILKRPDGVGGCAIRMSLGSTLSTFAQMR